MPLAIGTRLGPYEVLCAIGSGGMGEVYRARDTKLNRDVALKVLPTDPDRSSRLDRLARFQREAQVLAALNHPNIAHIHGLEDSGSVPALIMELVDGPTLAELLTSGRCLLFSDALAIARQIADALETAHSQHIIHRDLKPANIKLKGAWAPGLRQGFGQARRSAEGAEAATPTRSSDGRLAPTRSATDIGACTVKVLDFGIAKVLASAVSCEDGDDVTLTALDTQAGLVIGTPAYMSPEQARGATVDERTDIWAFGCVLFEMITGQRPFPGTSTAQVIGAVIERDPDWTAVSDVPAPIRRLLRRCLQKDPRRRLRDIGDARLEIEEAQAGVDETRTTAVATSRRPWWPAAVAGLVIGAAAALVSMRAIPRSNDARTNVRLENVTDAVGREESPAISPDGKNVAYVAYAGRRRQIWIRLLTTGAPVQITNVDLDHEQPRWDPDSNTIIYFTRPSTQEPEGTLWESPALAGQQPRPITTTLGGGDISHDRQWIAVFKRINDTTRLMVLRRDGSNVRELVPLAPGHRGTTPRWAPDDQSVAYIESGSEPNDDMVVIVRAGGGVPQPVVRDETVKGLSWTSDGSGLIYGLAKGSTVLYPPTFHLRLQRLAGGDGEQITFGDDTFTEPDVHKSGLLLATRTKIRSALTRVPTTGTAAANARDAHRITQQTSQVQAPSASPDGQHVVYLSDSGGHGNLWVIGTDGVGRRQITFEQNPAISIGVPVWSSDDTQVVFMKQAAGVRQQWLVRPDGSGPTGSGPTRLLNTGFAAAWSPDGSWLYYTVSVPQEGTCIEKLRITGGSNGPERVRCAAAIAAMPRADGTLFFQTRLAAPDGGSNYEIRRAKPEGGESTRLVIIDGRRLPYDSTYAVPTALSPDGKWLAYAVMDGATTNLWKLPTDGGQSVPITDFGDRALWILRQITWPVDKFIYAAIADIDADIVSIAGVVGAKGK